MMTEIDIKRIQDILDALQQTVTREFELIGDIFEGTEGLYPFSEFWDGWKFAGGKKISLHECQTLYSKLDNKTRRMVLDALLAQKEENRLMKKHGACFIPVMKYPATWLRKKSWLDSVSTEEEIVDEINRQRIIAPPTRQQQATDSCWDDD